MKSVKIHETQHASIDWLCIVSALWGGITQTCSSVFHSFLMKKSLNPQPSIFRLSRDSNVTFILIIITLEMMRTFLSQYNFCMCWIKTSQCPISCFTELHLSALVCQVSSGTVFRLSTHVEGIQPNSCDYSEWAVNTRLMLEEHDWSAKDV